MRALALASFHLAKAICSVDLLDAGFLLCGLPNVVLLSISVYSASCELEYRVEPAWSKYTCTDMNRHKPTERFTNENMKWGW